MALGFVEQALTETLVMLILLCCTPLRDIRGGPGGQPFAKTDQDLQDFSCWVFFLFFIFHKMYISKKECINKENTYISEQQIILFHMLFNYKYLQQMYINSLHQFTIHVFQ